MSMKYNKLRNFEQIHMDRELGGDSLECSHLFKFLSNVCVNECSQETLLPFSVNIVALHKMT